jgi:DNA-directed RNA polymerase subunit RPC12/RpoP
LEFDPVNARTPIQCPHCGMETTLFIPAARPQTSSKTAPRPQTESVPTVRLVEHTTQHDTGIQSQVELQRTVKTQRSIQLPHQLDRAGESLFAIGLLAAFIALGGALIHLAGEKPVLALLWLAAGLLAGVHGYLAQLLFRLGAEHLRLLAAANESRLSGTINQRKRQHTYKCSQCNARATPGQTRCQRCGAEFQP